MTANNILFAVKLTEHVVPTCLTFEKYKNCLCTIKKIRQLFKKLVNMIYENALKLKSTLYF